MKWFRARGGEFSAIEAALRSDRPRPDAELERAIAERVGGRKAERGTRPVLAIVMTAGAAAAFLSFGGSAMRSTPSTPRSAAAEARRRLPTTSTAASASST
jgi:hypothetical protein